MSAIAAFCSSVSGFDSMPASASLLRKRSMASSYDDFSDFSSVMTTYFTTYHPAGRFLPGADLEVRMTRVETRPPFRVRRLPPEPQRRRKGRLLRRHDGALAGAEVPEPQEREQGGADREKVRRAPRAEVVRAPESHAVREGARDGSGAGRQPSQAWISRVRWPLKEREEVDWAATSGGARRRRSTDRVAPGCAQAADQAVGLVRI